MERAADGDAAWCSCCDVNISEDGDIDRVLLCMFDSDMTLLQVLMSERTTVAEMENCESWVGFIGRLGARSIVPCQVPRAILFSLALLTSSASTRRGLFSRAVHTERFERRNIYSRDVSITVRHTVCVWT